MDQQLLWGQLPTELTLLIVELLKEREAFYLRGSCKCAEQYIDYIYRKRCLESISESFRGYKSLTEIESTNWLRLYNDAKRIREKVMIAWSFHLYTNDPCERAIDNSKNKCHGIRTFTEITDGQFGKAMRLPLPVPGSIQQIKGSQVQAMLTSLSSVSIKGFTLSLWLKINVCDMSPLISLLFTPKPVTNQKTMMQGLSFIILNITSNGKLFFGRAQNMSEESLKPNIWYHLVMTGHGHTLQVHVWDRETDNYLSLLSLSPSSSATSIPTPSPSLSPLSPLSPLLIPEETEKMAVMVGNGKKGEYVVEEMCVVGERVERERFGWLREGLAFV